MEHHISRFLRKLEGHDYELEKRIFSMYRNVVRQKCCLECRRGLNVRIENCGHPVSFYVVGDKFRYEKYRVVFVGKTAWTNWERNPVDEESGFIDARIGTKDELFMPPWSTTAFWQCIKEICWKLWGICDPGDMWRRIMITNIVKCTVVKGVPDKMKEYCILKCRFLENEVKIVKPTHIIFFTCDNRDYYARRCIFDYYIEKLDFGYDYSEDITDRDHKDKDIRTGWWHRIFIEDRRIRMHMLRVWHPREYQKRKIETKEKFAEKIADWIKKHCVE